MKDEAVIGFIAGVGCAIIAILVIWFICFSVSLDNEISPAEYKSFNAIAAAVLEIDPAFESNIAEMRKNGVNNSELNIITMQYNYKFDLKIRESLNETEIHEKGDSNE